MGELIFHYTELGGGSCFQRITSLMGERLVEHADLDTELNRIRIEYENYNVGLQQWRMSNTCNLMVHLTT